MQKSAYVKGYDFSAVDRIAAEALGEDTDGARREFVELVKAAESVR